MTQLVIEAIALLTICLGLVLVIACLIAPGISAVRSIKIAAEEQQQQEGTLHSQPKQRRMSA